MNNNNLQYDTKKGIITAPTGKQIYCRVWLLPAGILTLLMEDY